MGSDRSLDDFLPDETDADGRSDDGEAERAERDGSEPDDTEPSTGDGGNVEVTGEPEPTSEGSEPTSEGSEPTSEGSEPTAGGTDTGSTVGDATMADPAVSTATWTTDGAACERCDDVVKRRWLDDGKRVCSACKEW